MLRKVFIVSCISVAILTVSVLLTLPTPTANNSQTLVVENATIFNGNDFIEGIDLEISDGVITAMGSPLNSPAKQRIDATGKTLIPGLIDAHTHSFGNALTAALRFGVTAHIDMFTPPTELKKEIEIRHTDAQSQQADLFSAGMLATADGGHGTQFAIAIETLSTPNDAEAWVAKRISEGSNFIKLVYMPYSTHFKSLDRATSRAIINAAHKKGVNVVAHISTQRAALELLEDGIDGLVHIFADEKVTSEFINLAKENGIFVIPTLSVIAAAAHQNTNKELINDSAIAKHLTQDQTQQLLASFGQQKIPGFDFEIATDNTRQLHAAGIRILAGSDAPNPGTTYGATLHQEIELLTRAGLSPSEAINAASRSVAQAFKLTTETSKGESVNRGHLIVGAKADFIILKASPSNDIKATRRITSIYKNGRLIKHQTANNTRGEKIANPILSDFTGGLNTPSKLFWSATDDSRANGLSTVTITLEADALKVNASVKQGFMFPWAGASLFGNSAIDISDYSMLRFKVRGTTGQYQVMMFSGSQTGAPPSQTFGVSNEWRTITLPLGDFKGLDRTRLSGLAIVAGPNLGEFEYYLDDLKLIK